MVVIVIEVVDGVLTIIVFHCDIQSNMDTPLTILINMWAKLLRQKSWPCMVPGLH